MRDSIMKTFCFICALAMSAATMAAHAGDESGAILLEADFNDEPLDQQIGAGGPELGQPISVDADLSAIVRAGPMSTPSLEIGEAAGGHAWYARFEFLGSEEVTHGDLEIRVRVEAAQFDTFAVSVREQGAAVHEFASLLFTGFGAILVSDANGSAGTIGSYSVNVVHQLAFLFHMDDGTYDVKLDGTIVLDSRAHGVTGRGVGAVFIGTGTLTTPGALFYVDRLRVTRGDGIYRDGFD
jgi:hypothetical protein